MISDSIKFLHAQFSEVLLAFIIIIAFLCLIILMRRFRMEQYASKKTPDTGASEGTLRALLQEIQSMPQGTAPAKAITLDQLSEKDRARIEREIQHRMAEAGDAKSEKGAEVLNQLKEKDSELQRLQVKIKELQSRLEEAGNEGSEGGPTSAEIESLQGKIQDLEARLKEYEIIEDDIADLSNYKEENARLRDILESKGVDPAELDSQPPAESASIDQKESVEAEEPATAETELGAAADPEPAATEETALESSPAEAVATEQIEAPATTEAEEPAVHVDADQLLTEVDELLTLGEQEIDDSSALDEDLNTDKLLQEAKGMPGDQAGE